MMPLEAAPTITVWSPPSCTHKVHQRPNLCHSCQPDHTHTYAGTHTHTYALDVSVLHSIIKSKPSTVLSSWSTLHTMHTSNSEHKHMYCSCVSVTLKPFSMTRYLQFSSFIPRKTFKDLGLGASSYFLLIVVFPYLKNTTIISLHMSYL